MSWQMGEQLCLLSAWACMIRGSVFPYAWPSLWLDQWPAFDNPVCWDVQRDLSLFSQKPHRPSRCVWCVVQDCMVYSCYNEGYIFNYFTYADHVWAFSYKDTPKLYACCCCLFGFSVAFKNFSVISRRCLVATGSSMFTFIVLPHWSIMPQTLDMMPHPVTLSWDWVDQT